MKNTSGCFIPSAALLLYCEKTKAKDKKWACKIEKRCEVDVKEDPSEQAAHNKTTCITRSKKSENVKVYRLWTKEEMRCDGMAFLSFLSTFFLLLRLLALTQSRSQQLWKCEVSEETRNLARSPSSILPCLEVLNMYNNV